MRLLVSIHETYAFCKVSAVKELHKNYIIFIWPNTVGN